VEAKYDEGVYEILLLHYEITPFGISRVGIDGASAAWWARIRLPHLELHSISCKIDPSPLLLALD